MAKQAKTNFTQIPNQVLDTMYQRTPAENLVLFAICRKTYGWQKTRDQISLSQIMLLTGISKQGVLNCLKSLKLNNWIESDKDQYGNILYMSLEKEESELMLPRIEPEKWKKISDRSKPENSGRKSGQTIRLVKSVDRSNHLTATSQTIGQDESNHLTATSQTIGHTKETINKLTKENEINKEDPAKITIGNFIDTFIQRHSEFSFMRTKASRESADRMNMPFDDLDCEMRMEELINLAKMYDEIIWRSNELSTWYKNKGFLTAMPVTITYLTRKKKDIEDAFGSLPVMDYMDRANKEHNEYLSTLNAPKTSSQIIAEREAAGEVIDYSMIL